MVEDVISCSDGQPHLNMTDPIMSAMDELKDFLFDRIYLGPPLKRAREQVFGVIDQLFDLYMSHDDVYAQQIGPVPGFPQMRARAVCDYIAGMTDRFARKAYTDALLPSGFPEF